MATQMNRAGGWGASVRDGAARGGARIGGALLILLSLLLALALASYDGNDDALNTVSGAVTANWMGSPGAIVADALLTLFGPAAVLLLPVLLVIGVRSTRLDDRGRPGRALALATTAVQRPERGTRTSSDVRNRWSTRRSPYASAGWPGPAA